MKLLVFSIYDAKTLVYSQPFYMTSRGAALRSFQELCEDTKTTINKHPSDFSLVEIGTFDDADGVFENPNNHHSRLASALEYVRPMPQKTQLVVNEPQDLTFPS